MLRYTLMPFTKLCFFKASLRPTSSKIALNGATASNFDEYADVDVRKEATSVLQLLPQQRPHRWRLRHVQPLLSTDVGYNSRTLLTTAVFYEKRGSRSPWYFWWGKGKILKYVKKVVLIPKFLKDLFFQWMLDLHFPTENYLCKEK